MTGSFHIQGTELELIQSYESIVSHTVSSQSHVNTHSHASATPSRDEANGRVMSNESKETND